ncbi:hypothetical protein VA7868_02330 [Vibrio aerogenes CECT 7868]|uniref:Uncharacterized protein n=1 Tax=Vibrio aerogenes CECT 7868 TaxID=1216006 RepID=A0A1M5Z6Z7_9VIBR|nr:contractile injection system tape measure protein [Vibrio aerogenes]SHI19653.1 hypothetical protein VA7868_02330 [Vibrio aerogenes CECT 7868]
MSIYIDQLTLKLDIEPLADAAQAEALQLKLDQLPALIKQALREQYVSAAALNRLADIPVIVPDIDVQELLTKPEQVAVSVAGYVAQAFHQKARPAGQYSDGSSHLPAMPFCVNLPSDIASPADFSDPEALTRFFIRALRDGRLSQLTSLQAEQIARTLLGILLPQQHSYFSVQSEVTKNRQGQREQQKINHPAVLPRSCLSGIQGTHAGETACRQELIARLAESVYHPLFFSRWVSFLLKIHPSQACAILLAILNEKTIADAYLTRQLTAQLQTKAMAAPLIRTTFILKARFDGAERCKRLSYWLNLHTLPGTETLILRQLETLLLSSQENRVLEAVTTWINIVQLRPPTPADKAVLSRLSQTIPALQLSDPLPGRFPEQITPHRISDTRATTAPAVMTHADIFPDHVFSPEQKLATGTGSAKRGTERDSEPGTFEEQRIFSGRQQRQHWQEIGDLLVTMSQKTVHPVQWVIHVERLTEMLRLTRQKPLSLQILSCNAALILQQLQQKILPDSAREYWSGLLLLLHKISLLTSLTKEIKNDTTHPLILSADECRSVLKHSLTDLRVALMNPDVDPEIQTLFLRLWPVDDGVFTTTEPVSENDAGFDTEVFRQLIERITEKHTESAQSEQQLLTQAMRWFNLQRHEMASSTGQSPHARSLNTQSSATQYSGGMFANAEPSRITEHPRHQSAKASHPETKQPTEQQLPGDLASRPDDLSLHRLARYCLLLMWLPGRLSHRMQAADMLKTIASGLQANANLQQKHQHKISSEIFSRFRQLLHEISSERCQSGLTVKESGQAVNQAQPARYGTMAQNDHQNKQKKTALSDLELSYLETAAKRAGLDPLPSLIMMQFTQAQQQKALSAFVDHWLETETQLRNQDSKLNPGTDLAHPGTVHVLSQWQQQFAANTTESGQGKITAWISGAYPALLSQQDINEAIQQQRDIKPVLTAARLTVIEQIQRLSVSALPESQWTSDGGLVLLWPFLPTLFHRLSLLVPVSDEQGRSSQAFISEAARLKAYSLLIYLLGEDIIQDGYAGIANLLTGYEADTLIDTTEPLTEEEQQEADRMLNAVVSRWDALKNMSAPAFRQLFLQRPAKTEPSALGFSICVEKQTIDILMEKMPWGIGIIRLPWLGETVLSVSYTQVTM